jgi:hypothetical protein
MLHCHIDTLSLTSPRVETAWILAPMLLRGSQFSRMPAPGAAVTSLKPRTEPADDKIWS